MKIGHYDLCNKFFNVSQGARHSPRNGDREKATELKMRISVSTFYLFRVTDA